MTRLKKAETILNAADRWKQQCLIEGGSLFSETPLWTTENFLELKRWVIDQPNEETASFDEKLRDQLSSAVPEAPCLWAEVTWIFYLIVSSVSRTKKLDRIQTAWKLSGKSFPDDHWALGDVLERGIINPGMAFFGSNQWFELRFIILLMLAWTRLPTERRNSLLDDPWEFAKWIETQPDGRRRPFRHAILYLLYPDSFEPIVSITHKRKIVKAFQDRLEVGVDLSKLRPIDLDRKVLEITESFQNEYPKLEEVNYYSSPLVEKWPFRVEQLENGNGTVDQWYQNRFGTADVWAVGTGEGGRLWDEFRENGFVAVGYLREGDLSLYSTHAELHDAMIEIGRGKNPVMNSLGAWEFVHEIKIGDYLVAKQGRNTILGWGKVTGEYVYDSERAEYRNLRNVDWYPCSKPIHLDKQITVKTLTRFTGFKRWLKRTFDLIDGMNLPPPPDRYDIPTALSGLFIDEDHFRGILKSFGYRKNLILQGPPGVGKTFIARRIAWCLIGHKDSNCVEMVQFHQSYAYEDFVQGWRPTESGGFTLRNGVFYSFCKKAEQEPSKKFVFIIDEINRGNLSRIFGELLMLIESDKRGPDHAIPLTYSEDEERFSVPENVYLLGLMNTADRSLAMVDYALRRRFAFETLVPAFGSRNFREYLLEADVEEDLVDRIVERMLDLNKQIREDSDLGSGFEIGHSFFVPDESADADWFKSVVDTQISPLLREYWFDKPDRVNGLIDQLRQ